jgi:hypothetical protein
MISIAFLFAYLCISTIPNVFAKSKPLSEDCIASIAEEKSKFEEAVMKDVLSSYNMKLEEIEEVISYDIHDLRKISILTGKTESHMKSIFQQFESISLGQKQLFFFNGDVNTAYIFYKNPQYKNVMIKMARGDDKWSVAETKIVEGKKINFKKENCKDEHIINQGFNGLFKGLD